MIELEPVISAVGGGALVAVLAKSFIERSMRELEEAIDKIGEIRTELAKISVKLDAFEKSHVLLTQIDRKVVALETKVYRTKKHMNGGGDYETL